MEKKKPAICMFFVALLLSTFLLIQPAVAQGPDYQNISVQQAKHMIKHSPNLLILDVRNESEYALGHLYDAVWIPLHELEDRVGELVASQNNKIIVYCGVGGRSAPACQILADHGFTKVYNLEGGITAWMQANYPIDTTYHYVSVKNAHHGKYSVDIQPLLLRQSTGCTSGNASTPDVSDVTITVLEENENHTVMQLTYEVNGSIVETTIEKTLLWTYNTAMSNANKTITLLSLEVITENNTLLVYNLKDIVQHEDYDLSIDTVLIADAEGYSTALTNMSYTPTTDKGLASFELVEFNSSMTLSQHYKQLGGVAEDMAQVYQRSENRTLKELSSCYKTMSVEAKSLSSIVQTQLSEYNQAIDHAVAYMSDNWLSCILCAGACIGTYAAFCAACCILTGVCCVCVSWVAMFGLEVACSMICEYSGLCP